MNQLNAGANQIWEHILLDPSTSKQQKRRPGPKDSISVKSQVTSPTFHETFDKNANFRPQFIKAKHVNLEFILKPNLQASDDASNLEADLSKQLFASVRSHDVMTSLRLLAQGGE